MNIFLNKYMAIIRANWQRALAYRFTIAAYRAGEVGEFLLVILLWSSIYGASGETLLRGFTLHEMVTYFLVGNLFNMLVRSFASERISKDIKRGRLSVYLIRPINYFLMNFVRGFASLATIMSVATQLIVTIFFLHLFILNIDIAYLSVIFLMAILAFVIEFMIAYLVALVAFWTDETEGIYFSVNRVKRFFVGSYFPISLLPAVFVQISLFLPFGYSFFIPAQLYLKKIGLSVGIRGLFVQLVWIVLLYCIISAVWRRGLKRYESVGI